MPGTIDRRHLLRAVLDGRDNLLLVAGLGAPAWDVTAVGDTPANLPLWGGMGGAAMVGLGLGLALARPDRRVLVVTGDGEMLMGLGSLVTVAVQRPPNLAILVLDNERYGETGMQPTHTAHGADLLAIARGAGIATGMAITDPAHLTALRTMLRDAPGPVVAVAKVAADPLPLVLPPREGAYLTARFREALLGPEAHTQS